MKHSADFVRVRDAALDDDDIEKLARWFSTLGQLPRATGMRVNPNVHRDPPSEPTR